MLIKQNFKYIYIYIYFILKREKLIPEQFQK